MENFANNFVTTLAAAIGAADTSLTVATSTGSPAANFRILIESEYMLVTAKSGNTWQVTRGIEGSVATAHAATYTNLLGQVVPTEVAQVLTAGALKQFVAESQKIALVAATSIIAFKLITTDSLGKAVYADADTLGHVGRVLGVASNAAAVDGELMVQANHVISNSGWSWSPLQLLYLGLNGDITASQQGLICVPIGYAKSATEVFIDIQRGIYRG
jgi:hypothetical protein